MQNPADAALAASALRLLDDDTYRTMCASLLPPMFIEELGGVLKVREPAAPGSADGLSMCVLCVISCTCYTLVFYTRGSTRVFF